MALHRNDRHGAERDRAPLRFRRRRRGEINAASLRRTSPRSAVDPAWGSVLIRDRSVSVLNLPLLPYPTPQLGLSAVPRYTKVLNTRNLVAICCRVVLLTGMILASTNRVSSPAMIANASPINPGQIDVLDGDTIRVAGETFRLVGFDAPETYRAQCPAERELGNRATFRLRQIVAAGGSHAARQR